jgi:hypothetical protein
MLANFSKADLEIEGRPGFNTNNTRRESFNDQSLATKVTLK